MGNSAQEVISMRDKDEPVLCDILEVCRKPAPKRPMKEKLILWVMRKIQEEELFSGRDILKLQKCLQVTLSSEAGVVYKEQVLIKPEQLEPEAL